jgi:hypothetical protein
MISNGFTMIYIYLYIDIYHIYLINTDFKSQNNFQPDQKGALPDSLCSPLYKKSVFFLFAVLLLCTCCAINAQQ